MGQARFIECGEILERDIAKGFPMQRFVPVLSVNDESLVVMALEKQSVGKVALDEDQIVAVRFLDPVADLVGQRLGLFATGPVGQQSPFVNGNNGVLKLRAFCEDAEVLNELTGFRLIAWLSWVKLLDYFFTPKTASFAALATRNLSTVLAGILIFCCVEGLIPVRAFLFCFTSFPNPGTTNSPFFLAAL
jgi:hypothetical protein